MALIRVLAVVAALAALAAPAPGARAEALPGVGAPALEAALAGWLADDDAAALPAFAALAAEGSAAAGILLALVDRMPETHAPWMASLTRAERRALMRAPDGRAWMEAAGEAPLARAWLELWRADADPAVAFDFADLGEARAARLALLAHRARERGGFPALAEDPRYPPELLYLAWAEAPERFARAPLAGLPPGDPQPGRLDAGAAEPGRLALWLRTSALGRPLVLFCEEACGADAGADACATAAYAALGGYAGLFQLGPPSETLVPPDIWFASPKGMLSVPRRIAVLRPPEIGDACLAGAVARAP